MRMPRASRSDPEPRNLHPRSLANRGLDGVPKIAAIADRLRFGINKLCGETEAKRFAFGMEFVHAYQGGGGALNQNPNRMHSLKPQRSSQRSASHFWLVNQRLGNQQEL